MPPGTPLYFGGSSPAAHEFAARQVDAYLTWGEPVEAVHAKIADVGERAARHGRTVRFGIRFHLIVRETQAEAWADADRLISRVTDEDVARTLENDARTDSVGQARMAALHQGRRDRLVIGPNLWAGVGLVRGGAGPTLPKMTTDRKPMVRAGPVAPVQTRRTSRAACWRISKAL